MRRLIHLWRLLRWLERGEQWPGNGSDVVKTRGLSIFVTPEKVELQAWPDVSISCKTITTDRLAGALQAAQEALKE